MNDGAMVTEFSTCIVDTANGHRRDSPRPLKLRDQSYEAKYDWTTLFFDVFRVEKSVVFQGPPLFRWWNLLQRTAVLQDLKPIFCSSSEYVERPLGGEIWVEAPWDFLSFNSALGAFDVRVQPSCCHIFENRRVLLTMSKDNEISWIRDWVAFHRALHGADAVLIYDNCSARYSANELRAALSSDFPDMVIHVLSWPSKFGPSGAIQEVNGKARRVWDSNFGTFGALQHARFRFLRLARSVLHCDVDELVIGEDGLSVFYAAEASSSGVVSFRGSWISGVTSTLPSGATPRHHHFRHFEAPVRHCPPKWCVRPSALDHRRHSYANHFIDGKKSVPPDDRFCYRHFWALSTGWKTRSRQPRVMDTPIGDVDEALDSALHRAEMAYEFT